MPFTKFIDYLTLEKKYSPHTVTAYKRDLENFLGFASQNYDYRSINDVNYSIIRSWIVALVDDGISNRSVNRKISSLNTYYKFLLKTSQIEINPLTKHKALKTAKEITSTFFSDRNRECFEHTRCRGRFCWSTKQAHRGTVLFNRYSACRTCKPKTG